MASMIDLWKDASVGASASASAAPPAVDAPRRSATHSGKAVEIGAYSPIMEEDADEEEGCCRLAPSVTPPLVLPQWDE